MKNIKKKILIGAIGFASVLTLASATDRSGTDSDTERRPMFGSSITGYSDCHNTGVVQADGTPQCQCTEHYTTYVFWIGFEGERDWFGTCH